MNSGVSNVWTNFSFNSLVDTPNGWLFNKKSSFLIYFERFKKSDINKIKVYTHLFYANELGEPGRLKNTRLHSLNSAIEIWKDLISGGWTEVTNKFQ